MVDANDDPIELVPLRYEAWRERYRAERDRIRTILSAHSLERELGGSRTENTDGWQPVFRARDGQRFNNHVFGLSDEGWKISVVTRDVLRRRPELREEYERLKRELTEQYDDLTEYSRGKTRFIERVLDVARTDDGLAYEFAVP